MKAERASAAPLRDLHTRTQFRGFAPDSGTFDGVDLLELIGARMAAPDARIAVVCLEIDRLKQLRLTLHPFAGQQLLADLSRRLVATVGEAGTVGHFNIDEFAVMVDPGDPASVSEVTDAIVHSLRHALPVAGNELFVTVSVGIAYPDGQMSPYEVVRAGALAMHAARQRGHGQPQVYDSSLAAQMLGDINGEAELRRALESNELVLHHQPLLRVADCCWDRVETLVRWQHPVRGLLAPGDFLPIAERAGLMGAVGDRVVELAIAQAQTWQATFPDVQLSVNIANAQLRRPDFGDELLARLAQAGLPPSALLLEVTESVFVDDVETARASLQKLLDQNIRTAIDDFGTGYSSLARIGELPVTGVKIDRTFVTGLGTDLKARAIFAGIAEIVRAHGLLLVAEGIQTEGALAEAVALGCDFAQGYYLCRPGPAERIERVLATPVPERIVRVLGVPNPDFERLS